MREDNSSYKRLVRSLRRGGDERNVFQSINDNKQNRKEGSTVRLLKELQLGVVKTKE
jgi:hypothetical protein